LPQASVGAVYRTARGSARTHFRAFVSAKLEADGQDTKTRTHEHTISNPIVHSGTPAVLVVRGFARSCPRSSNVAVHWRIGGLADWTIGRLNIGRLADWQISVWV
jgi:hypothetical protein